MAGISFVQCVFSCQNCCFCATMCTTSSTTNKKKSHKNSYHGARSKQISSENRESSYLYLLILPLCVINKSIFLCVYPRQPWPLPLPKPVLTQTRRPGWGHAEGGNCRLFPRSSPIYVAKKNREAGLWDLSHSNNQPFICSRDIFTDEPTHLSRCVPCSQCDDTQYGSTHIQKATTQRERRPK